MQYKEAIQSVRQRRKESLLNAEANYTALLENVPALKKADTAHRAAVLAYANGEITAAQLSVYKKQRDTILKELKADRLIEPAFACKACRDTGMSGGRICTCALKLVLQSKANIEFPLYQFDDMDLTLFEQKDRKKIKCYADELKIIVEKGDASKRKNICLIGNAGTGKTFLASCVASECIALGRSVIMLTAFSLVQRLLHYHTSFDAAKEDVLSPLVDCDMLIIDDLGTESIYKNITLEYFYHIINERQLKRKHTMLTSNLTMDEIAIRYGERTASRLFDKRLCYLREFDLSDIRKLSVKDA